ncbi:hypothetical protein BDZ89DRAFT_695635 [Hymenopellis radicata]|nr:hypothetical protein BDZ89DRAFT_695635 [Hymenopellis radicata]
MVPTIYLAICLLPFAVAFAEIITARRQDLARPSQYNAYGTPPTINQAQDMPESDVELLDIVLVASVDGKFHAMNRTSGQTLWSMSSFSSPKGTPVPSTLAPLVRTIHNDHDPDLVDDDTNQETYIIEPQSGDIYVMHTPDSPLQRFPFSMAELVDMSPFSFADSGDRRVFVGRKETSLLLVELETGRIKATLNSECPWDPFEGFQDDDDEVDLDELDGSKPQVSPPTEVFIGRTDYHISIHSRPLKNSGLPPPPVQNLSFSTYGPNNQDNVLQAAYRRPRDDAYIQGLPNGNIISFKATGSESQASAPPLWIQRFTSPIVAVFDVLQKPSSHAHGSHTFVLLQPRPGLQELLPSLSLATAGVNLPNHQSAYVGMVEETGSLFAMSPLRYPLVAFGGSYTTPKRYIESPPVPTAVDEITRARKEMERERAHQRLYNKDGCEAENGEVVTDRRCLIGIRPLVGGDGEGAESRLKRLLNGSPSSSYPQLPAGEDDNDTRSSGVSKGKGDNIRRPDDPIRPSRGWLWDAVIITILGAFTLLPCMNRFNCRRSARRLMNL